MKKAKGWLEARGVDYAFHDYKKAGADAGKLAAWIEAAGLDKVLNRAGTSFRKLSDAEKGSAASVAGAVALMVAQPSLIKRPIVEHDGGLLVGFREAEWVGALG